MVKAVSAIKTKLEAENNQLTEVIGEQNFLLSSLPNLIAEDIPEGNDESDNKEIKNGEK